MRRLSFPAAAIALLLGTSAALAQDVPADTLEQPDVRASEPIPFDSLAFGLAPADTIPLLARRFRESDAAMELAAVPGEDLLPKNPRNAAIRAFLIPGWGQVHTGHPIRGVFYAASEVGFFFLGYKKQQDVLDVREEIDAAREAFFADTTQEIPEDPDLREALFLQQTVAIELFNDLEFHRERRDDYFAYAAASVIFAAVDAYVSAQLDPIEVGANVAERRAWAALRLPVGAPLRR